MSPRVVPRCRLAARLLVRAAVVLALCAAGTSAGRAEAQAEVPPEDVAAIARTLNCPLCQGYNLQDCPLEVCAQMREVIRQQLAAGATPEQVVAAFVADYGPQVLNAPPRTGFFATAWLVPLLVLVAAVALAVWSLRGAGRRAGPSPLTAVADAPGQEARPSDAPLRGVGPPDVPLERDAYAERLERMARSDSG